MPTTDQTKTLARALADCDPALVAAAPDLLAALEALAAQTNSKELAAAHDAARFAIAKAKGDIAGMWDAIPDSEKQVLTKAFSQGFSEQARGEA